MGFGLPYGSVARGGWQGRGDKLALSYDILRLIDAACDLVLRLAAGQLRQKASYLIDAISAAVVGLIGRTLNRLHTGTRSNANKITNRVPMLGHIKQINIL